MKPRGKQPGDERLPGEVAGALATVLPVTAEASERAAALRERVLARVRRDVAHSPREPATVHPGDGEWRELLPGLFEKVLYVDPLTGTRSLLLRGAAGTRIPAHTHRGAEECLLLEGEVRIGEFDLRPGDYHVAPPGTEHGWLTSESGFLAFLREPVRGRDR